MYEIVSPIKSGDQLDIKNAALPASILLYFQYQLIIGDFVGKLCVSCIIGPKQEEATIKLINIHQQVQNPFII